MMRYSAWLALLAALTFSLQIAEAGTVHGTVRNGTTGQNAAGIELALLRPMGGMQEVAHSKSDPQGEFTFDNPDLGTQPMLVQANYHGIHFNKMVPPGTANVQVDIFEPTKDPKTINVSSHVVVFQPNGTTLLVGEEYQIENKSQPPQAYYRTDGNFDFVLPAGGQLQQVSAAAGSTGVPVTQLPMDKKNNRYSIAYAFRPGDSMVRFSYELPYAGNAATVKLPTVHPGGRLLVVAPTTVQVTGDGLEPGGQEQGMNLYGRRDVPVGTVVTVNLSGAATAPPEAGAGSEQGSQGRDAQAGGEAAGASIQAVPGRLDGYLPKWLLLVALAVGFGFMAFLLWNKKIVAVPVGAGDDAAHKSAAPQGSKQPLRNTAPAAKSVSTAMPAPTTQTPTNGTSTMAEVDAAIGTSLDALKERLFRLELRRQAGTISEDEYARERAQAEKVLRDLVRG